MFNKRNAQGLSITTIIIAVIGLIIVIVLIAIFTGRIGTFGQGLDETKTCSSICAALGKSGETDKIRSACQDANGQILPGKFGDVTGGTGTGDSIDPNVCCCT